MLFTLLGLARGNFTSNPTSQARDSGRLLNVFSIVRSGEIKLLQRCWLRFWHTEEKIILHLIEALKIENFALLNCFDSKFRIRETPNFWTCAEKEEKKNWIFYVSLVTCHVSHIICPLSPLLHFACNLSPVTCHLSSISTATVKMHWKSNIFMSRFYKFFL